MPRPNAEKRGFWTESTQLSIVREINERSNTGIDIYMYSRQARASRYTTFLHSDDGIRPFDMLLK